MSTISPVSSAQNVTSVVVSESGSNNNSQRITQSFRDQKQIEGFIRSTKLLKIVEGAADQYVKTYQQNKSPDNALLPVAVRLPFAYEDFLQHPADLLHLAIEEPLQFQVAAKYSVYALVRDFVRKTSIQSGLQTVDIDQVHVQLVFAGLPLQRDLYFDLAAHQYRSGLSLLRGVLSAYTAPAPVVIQSVWYCATGCNRNRIKGDCIEAPLCSGCSRPMSEHTKLRYTHNFSLLRLLPVEAVESPRVTNKVFRAIIVNLKDHVYDGELALGARYLITGHYDYSAAVQEFQAWQLVKH